MTNTISGTEPSEPPSIFAADERRSASFIATASVAFVQRYPLIIGAAALVVVTALSTFSQWNGPTFLKTTGLGGSEIPEVEVIEVEYAPSSTDYILVNGDTPFGDVNAGVLASTISDGINELINVPRSPVQLEGAAGRNVRVYVVDEGEVLGKIAERNGISMFALAYSNNIVDPDSIRPGDKLRIPPEDGVLHVIKKNETLSGIAKKYKADAPKILSYNGLPADGSVLTVGDELVIPDGTPPAPPKPKYVPRTYSGPRYAVNKVPLGYYIAPTTGYNFGRRHSTNGVDIANSCGTPIYAAAAGTVIRSDAVGWNGGYGKVIQISHPNGTVTLYAHNSELMVGLGDYVAQGQLIALMGTTGRSTGCHVHFEVRGATNPMVRY